MNDKPTTLDRDAAVARLRWLGYHRLADSFADEAGRALAAAQTMTERLPGDLAPAREPALVPDLGPAGEAGDE